MSELGAWVCQASLALWIIGSLGANAQDELPLLEREPYDAITLSPAHGGATYRIFPLVPEKREGATWQVRLWDAPDDLYEIDRQDIARYQTFDAILLEEALRLMAAKDFDAAFHYLVHLRGESPDLPGLRDAMGSLVFQDAANAFRRGQLAEALSLLDEVRRVDAERAGLLGATENVATKMFEQYVQREEFVAARAMLDWAVERFGSSMQSTVGQWEAQLKQLARIELQRAQALVNAGDLRATYTVSRRAYQTWPELDGLGAFVSRLSREYPVVKVGVTRPAQEMDPRRAVDWASRRVGRLRYRTLVEIEGYGPDGGEYDCPVGSIDVSPDSRTLTIRLTPGADGSMQGLLSGYDLANTLLEMARPGGEQMEPLWSQLVESIAVQDVYNVVVRLRQPVLNPVSLLQMPLGPLGEEATQGPTNPYFVVARPAQQLRLVLNENYVGRRDTQPVEIIEQYFDDPATAANALINGDVDVVDRVFPGDLERLRRSQGIEIRPYAVPSIHFLVPNYKHARMQQRAFRRALVYGISRKTILEQDLLGNQSVTGCRLISGPLPPGIGTSDAIGYAYDERLRPRGYEPALAMTLAEVARSQLRGIAEKTGQPPPTDAPLILTHPAAAVPRLASSAISQYLSAIGIACETRELRAGRTTPADDQWDLLYVDMVVTEPMYDVRQLLGARGMIAGGSSYLEMALRRVSLVTTWEDARESLHDVHRLSHEEVAVLPLWQLAEHFAYHRRLQGVHPSPLSLYQGIEQWQVVASEEERR